MTTNHPAHGPVSLDRLHQIREILSKAAAQSDGGNLGYAMADAMKVIDGAIAAFGDDKETTHNSIIAEQLAHVLSSLDVNDHQRAIITCSVDRLNKNAEILQQAPYSLQVPEKLDYQGAKELFNYLMTEEENNAMVNGWNACRAAMLQAGNSPSKCSLRDGIEAIRNSGIPVDVDKIQSECEAANHTEQHLDMVDHFVDANEKVKDGTLINEGTIPATQIKPVADLYGITSPTGSETTFTFDASEASSFVGSDWSVQEYVELERYQQAVAGNSPVAQDGWIPASERMPNDKDFVWCWGYVSGWTESDGFEAYYDATRNKWWTVDDETVRKITHWMPLPAAPQQGVKRDS